MKNLQAHRNLANKLRNKYGYEVMGAVVCPLTGEASIRMANAADAEEMYEVFGEQGFAFGFKLS